MSELNVTTSSPWKVFKTYLLPSMLSLLTVSLYSFTDTFVVGQAMGSTAVAAMGLGTPVVSCLYALGFLFGTGGAVRYAVMVSQGKKDEARSVYTMSFMSALVLGIIFLVLGNIFIVPFAKFLGAESENLDYTVEYIRWIISLSGFLMMDIVLNSFMRNEGHPTVSAVATTTGTGINIVLDFLFVLGFKWGMSGAASATCIASIISVAINFTYSHVKKSNLRLNLKKSNAKEYFTTLKIGAGSGILEGAVAIITVVFLNAFGKYYGADGVAAYSVIITLNIFVYCLINGVSQAMQPIVSSNYGAKQDERCRKFLKYAILISVIIALIFIAAFELFTKQICSMFVDDSESVMNFAVKGLKLHSVSFLFMAVSIQLGIYFIAKENSLYSFLILLGRSVLFPVLSLLILQCFIKENAVWIAIPAGECIAMILSLVLAKVSYDKEKKSK